VLPSIKEVSVEAPGRLKLTAGRFEGETVFVNGYWDDLPGEGGGHYYWDAASTETADDGAVVSVDGVAVGRWILKDLLITPEHFGARGDGVSDDWDAFDKAVNSRYARSVPLRLKAKTYGIGQTLQI